MNSNMTKPKLPKMIIEFDRASYFKCIKMPITKPALVAAIKKATAPLKGDKSMPFAVITVKKVKPISAAKTLIYVLNGIM